MKLTNFIYFKLNFELSSNEYKTIFKIKKYDKLAFFVQFYIKKDFCVTMFPNKMKSTNFIYFKLHSELRSNLYKIKVKIKNMTN